MDTPHGLPSISCQELRQIQTDGKTHLVIDVREPADYDAGHIEQSLHIPFREIETNVQSLVHDKNELVVVVGERPEQAQETYDHLSNAGYKNARFLLGGFDEWCKPAAPDISDLIEDAELDKEIAEEKPEHHEEETDSENNNNPLL